MTNSKNTKKSLYASALALLLCFVMLIGTTFAWFTDSVTSGTNKIVAGNLDMGLQYKNSTITEYANVTAATDDIFKKDALWEPGHVEYVNLKVANLGTLAFKYKLGINIVSEVGSTNVNGQAFKLSDYLEYAVVDGTKTYTADDAGRTEALADAKAATAKKLNVPFENAENLYPAGSGNTSEDEVTLIVFMPEDVGNDANYKTGAPIPTIDMGVTAVATQLESEYDSFGNTYDYGATYPIVAPIVNTELNSTTTVAANEQAANDVVVTNENNVNAGTKVTATVPAANYSNAGGSSEKTFNTNVKVELTDSASDSTTYDIEVKITDENGNPVTLLEPAKVEVELIKGLKDVKVEHNGTAMTDAGSLTNLDADQEYYYDSSTGILYINSKTFSPFEVSYKTNYQASINGVGYLSLRSALLNAKSGDTVVVTQDWGYNYSTLYALAITTDNVTLDLNGHIVASQNKFVIAVLADNFTVKNGTVQALNSDGNQTAIMFQGVTGTVEDVDVKVLAPTNENSEYNTGISALSFNQSGLENAGAKLNNVSIKEVVKNNAKGLTVGVYAQGANITNTETLYTNSSSVYLDGCDIDVSGFALGGNGSVHGTLMDIKNSTITAGTGIYHPQYGNLNILNSSITGEATAIEMRSGNLYITSGTFTATGTPPESMANGSGATVYGAAIAVSQHLTNKPINVRVDGGTFNGAYTLYEIDTNTNDTIKSENVSITINGGTFNGEIMSVNNKVIDNRQ